MLKRFIRAIVRNAGFDIIRKDSLVPHKPWPDKLFEYAMINRASHNKRMFSEEGFAVFCAQHSSESNAQLFQDLFVLYILDSKCNGYFVEFGATDGIGLSNTYLLERNYGWTGILAEPARSWHDSLRNNRTAKISFECVWRESGQAVKFRETAWKELSTISSFARCDNHAAARDAVDEYDVNTISLRDLLLANNAPKEIDFLSIDTEGSEFDILQKFDFSQYRFQIIAVEHNFAPNRSALYDLLTGQGYRRLFENFSAWDDWYVLDSTMAREFGVSSHEALQAA